MAKGTITVKKNKKGNKIIVTINFTNNKGKPTQQPVQNTGISDLDLNGKEIEFERGQGGAIVKIVCDGKKIFKAAPKPQSFSSSRTRGPSQQNGGHQTHRNPHTNQTGATIEDDHIENITHNSAKAPYNFVPLNKKVVTAETVPDFNRYHQDRLTGYIELKIQTKTPLYIRDTFNKKEFQEQLVAEKKRERYYNADFFSPGKSQKIPGSSLRGMVRTLVEIVGFARFGTFDDRKLYYRDVAGTSSQGKMYKATMVNERDNLFPRFEAGLLKKQGHKYVIYPSQKLAGTQFYRVNFNKETKVIDGPDGAKMRNFEFAEFYFQPVSPTNHTHRMGKRGTYQLKYARLSSVSKKKDTAHPTKGYLVASGPFANKKHMHWIINEPAMGAASLEIPDVVVRDYELDTSRDERADLIEKWLKKGHPLVPCFYLRNSADEVNSFGHTGMFRLAYEKSIGEHIPDYLRTMAYEINDDRLARLHKANVPDEIIEKLRELSPKTGNGKAYLNKIDAVIGKQKEHQSQILKHLSQFDLAEAIFGNTDAFAGRVFFEDAILDEGQGNVLMEKDIPQLLQTPKPTTFQHYLVQKSNDLKAREHYNGDAAIRGNKLYWHKSGQGWEADGVNRTREKLITEIQPVKPDTHFTGRIRFENLSRVELGALLFVLKLPKGCLHKLGMGKPLGLGSVGIMPSLFISNRDARYRELIHEWVRSPEESHQIEEYINAFNDHVMSQLGKSGALWDTRRLTELKTLLNYEKGTSLHAEGKIRYMKIEGKNKNEYRSRPILPRPTAV